MDLRRPASCSVPAATSERSATSRRIVERSFRRTGYNLRGERELGAPSTEGRPRQCTTTGARHARASPSPLGRPPCRGIAFASALSTHTAVVRGETVVCRVKGETIDNSWGYVVVERVLVVSSEDVVSLSIADFSYTSVLDIHSRITIILVYNSFYYCIAIHSNLQPTEEPRKR